MIAVALLRPMPGMAFLRTPITLGIEFSQSLCKMTFQGRSGLVLLSVRVVSALSSCVAAIRLEPFCLRLVPSATAYHGLTAQYP